MSNIKAILTTFLALLSITPTFTNEECQVEKDIMTCKCVGNGDFYLPEEYIYKNTTSLRISSCPNAKLLYPILSEARKIKELIIEDIDKQLTLELMLYVKNFSRFELSNIKSIPAIKHDLFLSFKKIENFAIRNVFIESFEEHFTETSVENLEMVNVTIDHIEGFNFTEKGKNLKIINCEFRNITKSLNFYFTDVTIINSRFEMQKPVYFRVDSDYAFVQNNVFFNTLMELVGNKAITINNTCADGNSNLRLTSLNIKSFDNKWPTDIIDSLNNTNETGGNVICIAGNCKCPKSSGQNGNEAIAATSLLEIFLIWITYIMSRS